MEFLKEYLITDTKKLQRLFFEEVLIETRKALENSQKMEKGIAKRIIASNKHIQFLQKEINENKALLKAMKGAR